jgi:general secretion pathway protein A
MYKKHFNLTTSPFNAGPDPRFLYLTEALQEALAVLSYSVAARKGFVQLTGEVGTGKTTILNVFLQSLHAKGAATAFLFNPHLSADDLLDAILADFGIERKFSSKSKTLQQFNQQLLELYHADKLAVVFVDEAQQLSAEALEELRLLTNLETPSHKLLQIVLCGQPELEALLDRPILSQVRQRIALRCRTNPLSAEQTGEYIRQRLRIAGAGEAEIFAADAIALIHRYAAGIPRIINSLCEQSLIEAYCDGADKVDGELVEKAAREMGLGAVAKISEIRPVRASSMEEESYPGVTRGLLSRERML